MSNPELLYQSTPRRYNTYRVHKHRPSWTDSRETFQNAARKQYHLLLSNHRQANHCVTVKYLKEFFICKIRSTWSALRALLRQQGIVAFVVAEITTRRHIEPNGKCWDYPINQIHYHFLIDSNLSEHKLRDVFNRACLDAGLTQEKTNKEFEVLYEAIPDRATFEHKAEYLLKYAKFADQAILFQPGTGIDKIAAIGDWFINADGTRANKTKMWKNIVAGWYPNRTKQPIRITVRFQISASRTTNG